MRISHEGSSENHFISILDHLCFISAKNNNLRTQVAIGPEERFKSVTPKVPVFVPNFRLVFPHPLRAQSENFK